MASPEIEQIAAYQQGHDAAQIGQPSSSNPYAAQTTGIMILQYQSWLAGWTSVAAPGQDIGPLFTPRFELNLAQLLALNVTPVQIAPALPGYCYVPVVTRLSKPLQGAPFVVGGGALFQLGWENLAGLAFFSQAGAGFLNQVSAQERGGLGQFNTGAQLTNLNFLTQAKPNVPLVAKIVGAAITGGSPDAVLRGRVGFYLFPASL